MKNRLAKVGAMVMTVAVLATSTVPVLASEEIPAFSDGTIQQDNDATERGLFSKKYRVTENDVNVRSGPGKGYSILGTVNKGTILSVSSITTTGWAKVKFGSNTGYIYGEFLERVE